MRDFGEYVYGDEVTPLRLHLTSSDGTDFDLTGASAVTLVGRTLQGEVVELTGTVDTPETGGDVDFDAPGNSLDPGERSKVQVLFRVKWTIGGDIRWTPALGTFSVVRWP